MPQKDQQPIDEEEIVEAGDECPEQHVADLDDQAKRFLSMFATIRSKVEDLARRQSDIQRFELSIDGERKRLQKDLENAKLALRNSRIQIGAELAKVDEAGFSEILAMIKGGNAS